MVKLEARSRPTNVVFVIDQLVEPLGGAERALERIISHLPRDKFHCSLVTFRIGVGFEPERYFACPVRVFSLTSTLDWNSLSVARDLHRFLLHSNADIVHTFFESSDLYAGFITKLCTSAKLVWTRRDMGILRSRKHKAAYRIASSLPDLTLAVSDRVREFAIEHDRLKPGKTHTHYNGIDLPKIIAYDSLAEYRTRFGIPSKVPIVTTLANIRRVKGIDVVLRAAAEIRKVHADTIFLIVGAVLEPAYMEELTALTKSLRLVDAVKFTGEQKDVSAILQMSNVGLLLSRSEGFSNALLESMACCLPCVATRVGGNMEALDDGINGFLVDSEDSQSAANRAIQLLEDSTTATRIGAAARKKVTEKFSTLKMISDLERFYEKLLA